MTIEVASGWLSDIRASWWYNKFEAKEPSKLGVGTDEERWEYVDGDGNPLYANKAEEILAINQPFLQFFSEPYVISAIYNYAVANTDDPANWAHCRAAVSEEEGDLLRVDQGMHQPEENDDGEGFCLHATVRLIASTEPEAQGELNRARHMYMMQADDGSLYVTSMT